MEDVIWLGIILLTLIFGYLIGRADERRNGGAQVRRAELLVNAIGVKRVDKVNRRFVGESDGAYAARRRAGGR